LTSNTAGCPTVQSFNDGKSYGPCNGGQGAKYTSNSKYWVAIHDGAKHCGKTIIANYNGKKLPLVVMDVCPGCQSDNHVDMGLEALIELTGSVKNACAIDRPPAKITWDFTDAAAISLPIVVPNHVRLANRTQAFVSTIFTKTMVFPVTASKKVFAAPKTATYVAPTAEAGTGGFGVVSGAASEGSLLLGSFAFLQLLLSIRP
jgi:hypothetical protein